MSEETFIYTYTYGVTSAVPDAGPADSGSEASVTTTVANTKSAENIAEESVITSFVILPLQTSPFLQPKNCTTKIPGAIVCPGLSSGVTCTGVATANSDLTETVQASCFPSEYRNLLYDNDGNYRMFLISLFISSQFKPNVKPKKKKVISPVSHTLGQNVQSHGLWPAWPRFQMLRKHYAALLAGAAPRSPKAVYASLLCRRAPLSSTS